MAVDFGAPRAAAFQPWKANPPANTLSTLEFSQRLVDKMAVRFGWNSTAKRQPLSHGFSAANEGRAFSMYEGRESGRIGPFRTGMMDDALLQELCLWPSQLERMISVEKRKKSEPAAHEPLMAHEKSLGEALEGNSVEVGGEKSGSEDRVCGVVSSASEGGGIDDDACATFGWVQPHTDMMCTRVEKKGHRCSRRRMEGDTLCEAHRRRRERENARRFERRQEARRATGAPVQAARRLLKRPPEPLVRPTAVRPKVLNLLSQLETAQPMAANGATDFNNMATGAFKHVDVFNNMMDTLMPTSNQSFLGEHLFVAQMGASLGSVPSGSSGSPPPPLEPPRADSGLAERQLFCESERSRGWFKECRLPPTTRISAFSSSMCDLALSRAPVHPQAVECEGEWMRRTPYMMQDEKKCCLQLATSMAWPSPQATSSCDAPSWTSSSAESAVREAPIGGRVYDLHGDIACGGTRAYTTGSGVEVENLKVEEGGEDEVTGGWEAKAAVRMEVGQNVDKAFNGLEAGAPDAMVSRTAEQVQHGGPIPGRCSRVEKRGSQCMRPQMPGDNLCEGHRRRRDRDNERRMEARRLRRQEAAAVAGLMQVAHS